MALAKFPNFSSKNLQGYDFKGQNLTNADFSNADIRGANFTEAILKNANFQNAQAGLSIKQAFGLIVLTLIATAFSGFISGFAPVFTGYILFPYSVTPDNLLASFVVIFLILVFAISTIYKDLFTTSFVVTGTAIFCGFVLGLMTGKIAGIAAGVICITVTTLIVYAMLVIVAFLITVAEQIAGLSIAIVALLIMFASSILGATSGTVIGVDVAEVFTGVGKLPSFKVRAVEEAAIAATFASIILTFFIAYITWRVCVGDEKFAWMRKLAIAVSSLAGTSFQQADLTDTNFTNTQLKNANFCNAKLIHTNFHLAKNLQLSRVDNTILTNIKIRDLAVTKRGTNKSFVGCNLKGINLDYSDMSYADLTEADISAATFIGATLEGANLSKVQAIATNFQQAKLTAACLESWNIDSTTQLAEVNCDYVYLLNRQQERRPSSGTFAAGEFTKLFQVAINTVDLIFRNGLNLDALTAALTKIKSENAESLLKIKSIENKGDDFVVVRVDVATDANKAKIHAEITQNYKFALTSLEAKYQAELKTKDEQIALYRQHQADLKQLMQIVAHTKKTVDSKLVVLKLGQGNLNTGFSVTLQIGSEGEHPYFESNGKLPPASELALAYNQWQAAYRQSLQGNLRIKIIETQVTNISRRDLFNECDTAAASLKKQVNSWLNSELFRPVKEHLLEKLNPSDSIRILLQTEDSQLRRIPLHLWNFFERYPKAEIAISSIAYEKREKFKSAKSHVKILAILGDSSGIDTKKDRVLLEALPNAEVTFLVEPQRQVLNDELWLQPWDILFFAGHSSTQPDEEIGNFRINSTDSLTIAELKNALTKAIEQGLHLAIFNSCDGLGLALNLADLHIAQMIFMREPVPDKVAQEFLKNFLTEFSSGKPLYQSLREARSKLQGLENEFPYATWLPVICQNPAEIPLAWHQF